jgi:hypothetical protein
VKDLAKPSPGVNLTPPLRPDGTRPGWSRKTNAVKNFVRWALTNQQHQCAICGFIVGNVADRRAWSIDHIAPKGEKLYPQWTFEPLNLVITCHVCNSVFKNEYDSVATVKPNYVECAFSVVHPYLDSVANHLVGTYAGGSLQVGAPLARTPEGRQTIEIFHLNDPNYIAAINKQALLISIDAWKATATAEQWSRFCGALAELTAS